MSTPPLLDRRSFLKTVSAASVGVAAFGPAILKSAESTSRRKRYAIVGVGSRHQMYQDAIEKTHPQHAELVGICDVNAGRAMCAAWWAAVPETETPTNPAIVFEGLVPVHEGAVADA